MHKGKMVSVQSAYKNGRHISDNHFIDNIKTRNAVLKAGGKSKKLKNGTLIKIGIKNTSTPLTHCLVEGFSETEIYVSRFSYDMSPNLCALQFDSLAVIKFGCSLNVRQPGCQH